VFIAFASFRILELRSSLRRSLAPMALATHHGCNHVSIWSCRAVHEVIRSTADLDMLNASIPGNGRVPSTLETLTTLRCVAVSCDRMWNAPPSILGWNAVVVELTPVTPSCAPSATIQPSPEIPAEHHVTRGQHCAHAHGRTRATLPHAQSFISSV